LCCSCRISALIALCIRSCQKYHQSSTIIGANRPLENWGKISGDHAATSAIPDRLLDNVRMIKITGRSYRLKNVNKNKEIRKILTKNKKINITKKTWAI
jgi:DNA replication protein DnaC